MDKWSRFLVVFFRTTCCPMWSCCALYKIATEDSWHTCPTCDVLVLWHSSLLTTFVRRKDVQRIFLRHLFWEESCYVVTWLLFCSAYTKETCFYYFSTHMSEKASCVLTR